MGKSANDYVPVHIQFEEEDLKRLDKIVPKGDRTAVIRKLVKIFLEAWERSEDPYKTLQEKIEKKLEVKKDDTV